MAFDISFITPRPTIYFLFKGLAGEAGDIEDVNRWQPRRLELKGLAPIWEFLIPGDIIVSAFPTVGIFAIHITSKARQTPELQASPSLILYQISPR